MLADADALVENFAPGVMASLGLDEDTLRAHNPRLVVASVSNFGQTGPWRDYRATDMVEYALGGLMYIFGAYDREPLKHALHQAQFKAGTNLASATLMALYHQRLTGEGQRVDVSIQESIASALRDVTNNYTYTGAVRRRQPNHTGDLTRLRAVSDGYVLPNPGIGASLNWQILVDFLEALRNWTTRALTTPRCGWKTRRLWATSWTRYSPPSASRRFSTRPTSSGSSTGSSTRRRKRWTTRRYRRGGTTCRWSTPTWGRSRSPARRS